MDLSLMTPISWLELALQVVGVGVGKYVGHRNVFDKPRAENWRR